MEFYEFGTGKEVTETSAEILGGKGAGLVWMTSTGTSVPPGFIIPTTVWKEYSTNPKATMKAIGKLLPTYLKSLKEYFGYTPLLSVRSGARVSCPGMMDTILNVGLDSDTKKFWKEKLGDECWGNSLHRLITMYGSVVEGVDRESLEHGGWKEAIEVYDASGKAFPDAKGQLLGAIEAVFKSWDNERAQIYRKLHNIPREWGTAVTVQAMVFGNLNDESGTGVLFTRNPDTGERKVTGEFLVNAQGEDVVAGIRTPMPLYKMIEWNANVSIELHEMVEKLEATRKDMQDVEFTIQDGKLYILQTRNGKRSATAAIRIALDMLNEGMYTEQEIITKVTPKQLDLAQVSVLDPAYTTEPDFTGIGACSGVVTGIPVFSAAEAINCKVPCILITKETTPDDIGGMLASAGVITMEGGLTSHAAVVARGENKPCITGVGATVDAFTEATKVSMCGATGRVWLQEVPVISGSSNAQVAEFITLTQKVSGIVPAVYEIPKTQMEKAVLYLGVKMVDPVGAAKLIASCAVMVKELYVDLSADSFQENVFFSIFGTYTVAEEVVAELTKLVATFTDQGMQEIRTRVTLIGAEGGNFPPSPGGFKTIKTISDLRDLVLAEGEVLMDAKIAWDDAYKKVVGYKEKAGEVFTPISAGIYTPGKKSLSSVVQVLSAGGK